MWEKNRSHKGQDSSFYGPSEPSSHSQHQQESKESNYSSQPNMRRRVTPPSTASNQNQNQNRNPPNLNRYEISSGPTEPSYSSHQHQGGRGNNPRYQSHSISSGPTVPSFASNYKRNDPSNSSKNRRSSPPPSSRQNQNNNQGNKPPPSRSSQYHQYPHDYPEYIQHELKVTKYPIYTQPIIYSDRIFPLFSTFFSFCFSESMIVCKINIKKMIIFPPNRIK